MSVKLEMEETDQQDTKGLRLLARYILPFLFMTLGMASWMCINAIWVEMPLLAMVLPENWGLAAYVSVIIQIGNIGPLLVVGIKSKVRYSTMVYTIIFSLIVTTLVLSFVYDLTALIGGAEHSVAFLISTFLIATCDCASNVTFLPYMANFNPRYLVFFFIGQGIGGLLPSGMGLIQGSGTYDCIVANSSNDSTNGSTPVYYPSNFEFSVFFNVITGLLLVSLSGFIFIEIIFRRLKRLAIEEAKTQSDSTLVIPRISQIISLPQFDPSDYGRGSQHGGNDSNETANESLPVSPIRGSDSPNVYNAADPQVGETVLEGGNRTSQRRSLPFRRRIFGSVDFLPEYCINAFACCVVNGLMPGIQSYSSIGYGPLAYKLVACLWVIAVPIASWMTMCAKVTKVSVIAVIESIALVPIIYMFVVSALSPNVPLQDNALGQVLIVVGWFSINALLTFSRVSVAQRVQYGGHKALFWFGIVTQAASFFGAIVTFVVTQVFHIFKDPTPC